MAFRAIDAIDSSKVSHFVPGSARAHACSQHPAIVGRGRSTLSNYTQRIAFLPGGIKLNKHGTTQHPHGGGGGDTAVSVMSRVPWQRQLSSPRLCSNRPFIH